MIERPNLSERSASWDDLWRETERYYPLVQEKLSGKGSVSMKHILGNLSVILHPSYRKMISEGDPKLKGDLEESLSYIERYFRLLDEFPEFREKEEGGGEGYFPDLVAKNIGSRDLIGAYETALGAAAGKEVDGRNDVV